MRSTQTKSKDMNKESIVVKNGVIAARCYSKQELINAIKEASGIELRSASVATLVSNLEEEPGGRFGPESRVTNGYNDCGYIYTPVLKDKPDDETFKNHGYHRPTSSKKVEEGIWDEMLHSAWFYDETGIEIFMKTESIW